MPTRTGFAGYSTDQWHINFSSSFRILCDRMSTQNMLKPDMRLLSAPKCEDVENIVDVRKQKKIQKYQIEHFRDNTENYVTDKVCEQVIDDVKIELRLHPHLSHLITYSGPCS